MMQRLMYAYSTDMKVELNGKMVPLSQFVKTGNVSVDHALFFNTIEDAIYDWTNAQPSNTWEVYGWRPRKDIA